MRLAAITSVLLLSLPLVGSAWHVPTIAPQVQPLPAELSDGELLRLLAAKEGYHFPAASPRVLVPPGATLPGLVLKLAGRMGKSLTSEDLAPFARLDPRVAGPVLLLLVAVDQAWTAHTNAMSKLSPSEQDELLRLGREYMDRPAPRGEPPTRLMQLVGGIDEQAIINQAIILSDTLEGIVMPELKTAVQSGAWPPIAIADPAGVLRLGSPGNDIERVNRIVQIDPSGNDTYFNNAGGATLLEGTQLVSTDLMPIAISVDMSGNDYYANRFGQGAAANGIGIALDYEGNDRYVCGHPCQGGVGIVGVGLLHDYSGDDQYLDGDGQGLGASLTVGIGIMRDDAGNDTYQSSNEGAGFASEPTSIGLLWDRGGKDSYLAWPDDLNGMWAFGWGDSGGLGMLVDEGPETDYYSIASAPPGYGPHGCNDCTWTILRADFTFVVGDPGVLKHRQTGNDNMGGLAAILAANGP